MREIVGCLFAGAVLLEDGEDGFLGVEAVFCFREDGVGVGFEDFGGDFLFAEDEIADAQWFSPAALPLLPPKISIARKLIDDFVGQHAPDSLDPS